MTILNKKNIIICLELGLTFNVSLIVLTNSHLNVIKTNNWKFKKIYIKYSFVQFILIIFEYFSNAIKYILNKKKMKNVCI